MNAQCITLLAVMILITPIEAAQNANATSDTLKAGGSTYFTAKIENLTQQLQLNPDQQAKIKPIAEQEVGYLAEIRGNPALSKKEKLKKLESIVRNSDTQMKPNLSPEQWQKLQTLRKDQKQQLKELANAEEPNSN